MFHRIFESLPVLDDLGAKLSEIYGAKSDAKASPAKVPVAPVLTKNTFANDPKQQQQQQQNKWKMSFQHKDESSRNLGAVAGPSTMQSRASRPGKGLTPPDSDDEARSRAKDTKARQSQPKRIPSPLKQYGRTVMTRSPPTTAPPPVKSGPVVLDKFGSFR